MGEGRERARERAHHDRMDCALFLLYSLLIRVFLDRVRAGGCDLRSWPFSEDSFRSNMPVSTKNILRVVSYFKFQILETHKRNVINNARVPPFGSVCGGIAREMYVLVC